MMRETVLVEDATWALVLLVHMALYVFQGRRGLEQFSDINPSANFA